MTGAIEATFEARIPMRDLQDAMDCSLALTSQAIENEIANPDSSDGSYRLTVREIDYPGAVETIRRFREENRR